MELARAMQVQMPNTNPHPNTSTSTSTSTGTSTSTSKSKSKSTSTNTNTSVSGKPHHLQDEEQEFCDAVSPLSLNDIEAEADADAVADAVADDACTRHVQTSRSKLETEAKTAAHAETDVEFQENVSVLARIDPVASRAGQTAEQGMRDCTSVSSAFECPRVGVLAAALAAAGGFCLTYGVCKTAELAIRTTAPFLVGAASAGITQLQGPTAGRSVAVAGIVASAALQTTLSQAATLGGAAVGAAAGGVVMLGASALTFGAEHAMTSANHALALAKRAAAQTLTHIEWSLRSDVQTGGLDQSHAHNVSFRIAESPDATAPANSTSPPQQLPRTADSLADPF